MPRNYIAFVALVALLFSCETKNDSGDSAETKDLKNEIEQLRLDNAMKDSVINESLTFFNEIKANLEAIGIKKDEIRVLSSNPELDNDDRQWILEQINHINFMRQENANKVKQLNDEIKRNGLKIKELEVMVESLLKDIQWKDEQIALLQVELDRLDSEYSKLFDAYQEQAITIESLRHDLNTVYYAYGSEQELVENGVIERRNGFVGIGKKLTLKEHFNDDYFTPLDSKKHKSITIQGTDIRLITSHPTDSYSLNTLATKTIIEIKDPSEFWKISRYLVVSVK